MQLLPTILILIPFAAMGGTILARFGHYGPIHHAGFAMMMIGFGLLSLLHENSSTAAWVLYQTIEAGGVGMVVPTLLPAVLAPLTEADTALATATWAFPRTFGLTWGTAIPAAIFANRFEQLSGSISDPAVVAALLGGQAYEHATKAFLDTLSSEVRGQVVAAFSASLKRTWQILIAFAAIGFLLIIFQKEVPRRKGLDTEFGIKEKPTKHLEGPQAEANRT